MSSPISADNILNVAVGIERTGIAFYYVMGRSTDDSTAKYLFQQLADMERVHIKIFEDMLGEVEQYPVSEVAEHADYLQTLVDNAVFNDELVTSEMAMRVNSDIEAVHLAISAEKDTILFYYEMREVMPQPAQVTVDRIIAEEKAHLRQLSELKKKLTLNN